MDDETIDWILSDTTVDPVSKVPYATVVFMLYYCLELKHFLLKTSENLTNDFEAEIRDFGETSLYLAGSAAQGFYLNTLDFLDARDVDIVSVFKKDIRKECDYDKGRFKPDLKLNLPSEEDNGLCSDKSKSVTNTTNESFPSYLNIETWDDTYPGYIMLRKCRKHELPVQTSLAHRYVSSLETKQSRTEFWRNMQPYLENDFRSVLDHDRDIHNQILSTVHTQGPAASMTFSNMFLDFSLDSDLVYALPYPGWPEIADNWVYRKPASGWPSSNLKAEIEATGCLLVPKGHKSSRVEDFEWRISFSLAELKLARSLNRIQREIAHVLKALLCEEQYEFGQASVVAKLDSYFILNILFTESENIKEGEWKENNLAHIMFRFLDKLASSIKNKNLSHYFVRENNLLLKLLFDSVKLGTGEFKRGEADEDVMMDSNEYIDFALYTVLRLRHDPLGQLLQQGRYLRLPGAMHTAVFEQLVKQTKASSAVNPSVYVSTLIKLAKAHLYNDRFEEANIYLGDAEKFLKRLSETPISEDMKSDFKITKAVCSYLTKDYTSAELLFEEIEQTIEEMNSDQLEENRHIFMVLFARLLSSLAVMDKQTNSCVRKNKARRLLDKALSLNFNSASEIEVVNYFMVFGDLPEADLLLMQMQDRLVAQDDEIVEQSDPEVIYCKDACTFPVVDEPVYSVHSSDTEECGEMNEQTISLIDDEEPLSVEYPLESYFESESEITAETKMSENSYSELSCELNDFDFERDCSLKENTNCVQRKETEMELQVDKFKLMQEHPDEIVAHGTDSSEKRGVQLSDRETAEAEERHSAHSIIHEQDDPLIFSNDFDSLDESLIYNNPLDEAEEHDGFSIFKEGDYFGFTHASDIWKEQLKEERHDRSRPILSFHENQDLINLFALFRAFTELGLHNDATRVHQRLAEKVQERQQRGNSVTVEILDHDLTLYMSYVEGLPVHDDWENPFAKFTGDVMFSEADGSILDEVLTALVHKSGVVNLHVNDLYFHYRIELAKYDGKTTEALELVQHIRDLNLRSIHYEFLGEQEKAQVSAFYASLRREKKSVHEKVSQWIKQIIEAVSKFEPRNVYLESVFS